MQPQGAAQSESSVIWCVCNLQIHTGLALQILGTSTPFAKIQLVQLQPCCASLLVSLSYLIPCQMQRNGSPSRQKSAAGTHILYHPAMLTGNPLTYGRAVHTSQ